MDIKELKNKISLRQIGLVSVGFIFILAVGAVFFVANFLKSKFDMIISSKKEKEAITTIKLNQEYLKILAPKMNLDPETLEPLPPWPPQIK